MSNSIQLLSRANGGTNAPTTQIVFDRPETLVPAIVAVSILCMALTTLCTTARLVAKRVVEPFAIEDYVLFVSWIANVTYDVVVILQGLSSINPNIQSADQASNEAVVRYLQLGYGLTFLYASSVAIAKTALILQLQRLFSPGKRTAVWRICNIILVINVLNGTISAVLSLVQCVPVARAWDSTVEGTCINAVQVFVSSAIIHVVVDLVLLVVPLWAIHHLHMRVEKKAGVAVMFALGFVASICSIGRLTTTFVIVYVPAKDSTSMLMRQEIWTCAECASIILCTCFPFIPRLVKAVVGQQKTTPDVGASASQPVTGGFERPSQRNTAVDPYGDSQWGIMPESNELELDAKRSASTFNSSSPIIK